MLMDFVVCYHMVRYGSMDLWYVTVLRFKSGFSQPVFLQVVQSVIGRVDVDDTGGHQTKTSKTRSILEGKRRKSFVPDLLPSLQFVFFEVVFGGFSLEFHSSEAQLYLKKTTPPNSWNVCCFFATLTVRYPEYFRVPQDDSNASRTGALVDVKICKKSLVSCVIIFAYLRKPKSTDRPSERASRQ